MRTEHEHIKRILKTHDQLVKGIKTVALKLNQKFINEGEEVVVITILKGGLPFSLELIKHIDFDMSLDCITSSSYYLDKKSKKGLTKYEATIEISGKNIIIVDDLVDSGETIIKIGKILEAYQPKSITVTAIYGKPNRKKNNYDEFYVWEKDPGGFLLGFGLDYDEKYRNLPYIAIIKDDE